MTPTVSSSPYGNMPPPLKLEEPGGIAGLGPAPAPTPPPPSTPGNLVSVQLTPGISASAHLHALRGAGATSTEISSADAVGGSGPIPSRPDPRALLLRTTALPPEEEEEEEDRVGGEAAEEARERMRGGVSGTASLAPATTPSPPHASAAKITQSTVPESDAGSAGLNELAEGDLDKYLPVITDSHYYTVPSMDELVRRLREHGPSALKRVDNFAFGRHDYGEVRFDGSVDVTGLRLQELVKFERKGEVIGYPDGTRRPRFGEGLHRSATVELLGVFKLDKATRQPVKDAAAISKFESKLRASIRKERGEFIGYDPREGRWTFRVKAF